MRRSVRSLVLLGMLGTLARAQEMPDPRRMSGTPLADADEKQGHISVKVIRGDMTVDVGAGTPVHLVALRANGTATRQTVMTADDGRAQFDTSDAEKAVEYFAYCLLGQDRLESQPLTLPPQGGLKLVLSGRKLDAGQQPIGDPIDDLRRGDEESPKVPPEILAINLLGGAPPHTKVKLVEIPTLGASALDQVHVVAEAEAMTNGDHATARFGGIAADPNTVYMAELVAGGKSFRSRPFMLSPVAGVSLDIVLHDHPLFGFMASTELRDDDLAVQMTLAVANLSSVPYNPGPEGLLLPLPEGFKEASLRDEGGEHVRVAPGLGIVWLGLLPPGQTEIALTFGLPVSNGKVSVNMLAPLGVVNSQFVLEQFPGVKVAASPQTHMKTGTTRGDDGHEYLIMTELTVNPGVTVSFDVSGLPMPSALSFWVRTAAGVIVLLLFVWAFFVAVRPTPPGARDAAEATLKTDRRADLGRRRDRLYDQLMALERSRAAAKVDDAAYQTERMALTARLVMVHRELDDLDSGGGAGAGKTTDAP